MVCVFSSLSESGFIPTRYIDNVFVRSIEPSSHLFQRVASFLPIEDLIKVKESFKSSHLFQRVASFLPTHTEEI